MNIVLLVIACTTLLLLLFGISDKHNLRDEVKAKDAMIRVLRDLREIDRKERIKLKSFLVDIEANSPEFQQRLMKDNRELRDTLALLRDITQHS